MSIKKLLDYLYNKQNCCENYCKKSMYIMLILKKENQNYFTLRILKTPLAAASYMTFTQTILPVCLMSRHTAGAIGQHI